MYCIISGTLATQATSIIGGIDKIGGDKNYLFHCMYSIISGTLATQATSIIGGIDKIGGDKNYLFHCMYSIISGTLAGFVFFFKCSVYIEDKDNYFTLTKLYIAQYLIFCLTILINGSIFNILSYNFNKWLNI